MKQRIATIGFFDGVHRGHQYLISSLRRIAAQIGADSVVITFYQHPKSCLNPNLAPQLLTTTEERQLMLSALNPDQVVMLDFEQIQSLTAAQFIEYIHTHFAITHLLMGYDHRFGSDQLQHISDYEKAAKGVVTIVRADELQSAQHISSTDIRRYIANGQIPEANALLGYEYTLNGTITHGKQIGRHIGFPTANLLLSEQKLLPPFGVYAAYADINGAHYRSIVNIGNNPTVGGLTTTIEAHLLHFDYDIYGQNLSLRLRQFIRQEQTFPSIQSLQQQIAKDILCALQCL